MLVQEFHLEEVLEHLLRCGAHKHQDPEVLPRLQVKFRGNDQ
jgi:hypothetical protein